MGSGASKEEKKKGKKGAVQEKEGEKETLSGVAPLPAPEKESSSSSAAPPSEKQRATVVTSTGPTHRFVHEELVKKGNNTNEGSSNEPEKLDLVTDLFPGPCGETLAELVAERRSADARAARRQATASSHDDPSGNTAAVDKKQQDLNNNNSNIRSFGPLLSLDLERLDTRAVSRLLSPPSISVFLSSTFTDTRHERDALILHVYDWVRAYAKSRGVEFEQPSSMRWGIRASTSDRHETPEICFAEIARCKATSDGVSHVAILGDKYGFRPVPRLVPLGEWSALLANIVGEKDGGGFEALGRDDVAFVESWFRLDTNASAMVLRPAGKGPAPFWDDFQRLRTVLQRAALRARGAGQLTADQAFRYEKSITDDELRRGMLWAKDPPGECVLYVRRMIDPVSSSSSSPAVVPDWNAELRAGLVSTVSKYVDLEKGGDNGACGKTVDNEAQAHLALQRDVTVPGALTDRSVRSYQVPWSPGFARTVSHQAYLRDLCVDFAVRVCDSIDAVAAKVGGGGSPPELVTECAHAAMVTHGKQGSFTATSSSRACASAVVDHIEAFCCAQKRDRDREEAKDDDDDEEDDDGENSPFVVVGPSGSGKTSLMAHCAASARSVIADSPSLKKVVASQDGNNDSNIDPVVVVRYLGTSSGSGTARAALRSVCEQIVAAFGGAEAVAAAAGIGPAPSDLKDLAVHFARVLALASPSRPLAVFLDSLDQLSDEGNGRRLDWLPRVCPPHCALIVSTLPVIGGCLARLRTMFGTALRVAKVAPMTIGDAEAMLGSWLERDGRALTDAQRSVVMKAFEKCPSPLYLSVAYRLAEPWRSYDEPGAACEATGQIVEIPDGVPGAISDGVFARLESEHGTALVAAVCAFLTLSGGLSRSELLDLVSLNDDVLTQVFEWWTPPVRRVPPLILARVVGDLGSWLSRRGRDGVNVYAWHHRQLWTAATTRYLGDEATRAGYATQIADYFAGIAPGDRRVSPQGLWEACSSTNSGSDDNTSHRNDAPIGDDGGGGGGGAGDGNSGASSPSSASTTTTTETSHDHHRRRRRPNLRALTELPPALIAAGAWERLESLLCTLDYLEAALTARRLYDAIAHLNTLVEHRPDSDRAVAFLRFVRTGARVLGPHPELVAQMAFLLPPSSPVHAEAKRALFREEASGSPEAAQIPQRIDPRAPLLEFKYGRPTDDPSAVSTLSAHDGDVASHDVSACKRTIVSGSRDGSIAFFDAVTGELSAFAAGADAPLRHDAVSTVVFCSGGGGGGGGGPSSSATGHKSAAATIAVVLRASGVIEAWSESGTVLGHAELRAPVGPLAENEAKAVACARGGSPGEARSIVVGTGDGTVVVVSIDIKAGASAAAATDNVDDAAAEGGQEGDVSGAPPIVTFRVGKPAKANDGAEVTALSSSPDGSLLLVGANMGRAVLLRVREEEGGSDDSTIATVAIDPEPTAAITHDPAIARFVVRCAAFSPDGGTLVVGTQSVGCYNDQSRLYVYKVDGTTLTLDRHLDHDLRWVINRALQFSLDGKRLFHIVPPALKVWDVDTWQLQKKFTDTGYDSGVVRELDPSKELVVCTERNAVVIASVRGRGVAGQSGGIVSGRTRPVAGALALSSDGSLVIASEGDNFNGPSNVYLASQFGDADASGATPFPIVVTQGQQRWGNACVASVYGTSRWFAQSDTTRLLLFDMASKEWTAVAHPLFAGVPTDMTVSPADTVLRSGRAKEFGTWQLTAPPGHKSGAGGTVIATVTDEAAGRKGTCAAARAVEFQGRAVIPATATTSGQDAGLETAIAPGIIVSTWVDMGDGDGDNLTHELRVHEVDLFRGGSDPRLAATVRLPCAPIGYRGLVCIPFPPEKTGDQKHRSCRVVAVVGLTNDTATAFLLTPPDAGDGWTVAPIGPLVTVATDNDVAELGFTANNLHDAGLVQVRTIHGSVLMWEPADIRAWADSHSSNSSDSLNSLNSSLQPPAPAKTVLLPGARSVAWSRDGRSVFVQGSTGINPYQFPILLFRLFDGQRPLLSSRP